MISVKLYINMYFFITVYANIIKNINFHSVDPKLKSSVEAKSTALFTS